MVQNCTSSVLSSMVYGVMNLNKRQKLVLFFLLGFLREEKKTKNLKSFLYKMMRMISYSIS